MLFKIFFINIKNKRKIIKINTRIKHNHAKESITNDYFQNKIFLTLCHHRDKAIHFHAS